jgi:hypothetical protein
MVQTIRILLVGIFENRQFHVAIGQINSLSPFWRWTRLPKAKNFLVEASQSLGVVRADRYVPNLRHVTASPLRIFWIL